MTTYGAMGGTYGALGSSSYGTLFAAPANAGEGIYLADMPILASGLLPDHPVGVWRAKQAATGDTAFGVVIVTDTNEVRFVYQDAYPTGVETFVDESGPFVWSEGDEITWTMTYEKA